VKITIEISDVLSRRAKSAAAGEGIPLREFVTVALVEKLRGAGRSEKPWMKSLGKLRSLRKETARVDALVKAEFGRIEFEDWS
jgi:hypothetical protein